MQGYFICDIWLFIRFRGMIRIETSMLREHIFIRKKFMIILQSIQIFIFFNYLKAVFG